jgi:hypothetical protein
MYVAERLYANKNEGIGLMSRKKAHYASNVTMKVFLLGYTDAVDRLRDASTMSDHSFGTVFEALLELCSRKAGLHSSESCMKTYCDWVDANVPLPLNSIMVTISDFEHEFSNTTNCDSFDEKSQSALATLWQEGVREWVDCKKEVAKVLPVKRARDNPNATDRFEHVDKEEISATWRSNSKRVYEDPYYRCCGVRQGVDTCLRRLWIDASPTCYHRGALIIPDRKGVFQYGESQIGKGKTPIWTCCRQTSVAPGCISQQEGHSVCGIAGQLVPTTQYAEKVRSWLVQYEDIVEKERQRPVGWGGVVKG